MTVNQLCRVLAPMGMAIFLLGAPAAFSDPDVNPDPHQLDINIQALKLQVVAIEGNAVRVTQDAEYPPDSRVAVAVSDTVPKLLIYDIELTLDAGPSKHISFPDDQARALLNSGGLHQILIQNLSPGPHRLRAVFDANFIDARMDEKPLRGSLDGSFEKTDLPLTLELALTASGGAADLNLRTWTADAPPSEPSVSPPPSMRLDLSLGHR